MMIVALIAPAANAYICISINIFGRNSSNMDTTCFHRTWQYRISCLQTAISLSAFRTLDFRCLFYLEPMSPRAHFLK